MNLPERIEKAISEKERGVMFKPTHYLHAYDFVFSSLVGKKIKVLEIGIANGGSLYFWKEYFKTAEIYGIDIDPSCKRFESEGVKIIIGSQTDLSVLKTAVNLAGEFDIIIDDGGHFMQQMKISFDYLFPHLKEGGFYVVEDLGCCYNKTYQDGEKFTDRIKTLMDDMNLYRKGRDSNFGREISSIFLWDSICFIGRRGTGHSENTKAIKV